MNEMGKKRSSVIERMPTEPELVRVLKLVEWTEAQPSGNEL